MKTSVLISAQGYTPLKMFIGHFAVGFAAKKIAPHTSMAVLLAAPLLSDLLWPVFLLFGWEQVQIDPGNTRYTPLDLAYYPWSHSLLMCFLWATAFAVIYSKIARYWQGTVAVWVGVMSHWILDWISHRPDMPLYPGGPRLGLGLWNSNTCVPLARLIGLAVMPLSPTLGYCWCCMWAIASADRRAASPKLPGAGSSRELSSFPGQGGSTITAP